VDALLAFRFTLPTAASLRIVVGTLVMLANVVLLAVYTFSCHSCPPRVRR